MMRFHRYAALTLLLAACATHSEAQTIDPPAKAGRLSDITGPVSLYPSGGTDWADASLNYPLTAGDAIWADDAARAEIQLGSSTVRIAAQTSMIFGEVSDTVTQLQVDRGSIDVHVRDLADGEVYEVDTPAGVISLLDPGHYRIDVTADGKRATITVRDGGAQAQSGGSSYQLRARTSTTIGEAMDRPAISMAMAEDSWEQWVNERDRAEDAVASTQYVSQDMVGYQDLDTYGTWQSDATYGPVWTPRSVPAGWAPYRFGHWESIQPWGWTWIDDAKWGFAPFHYGRWAYINGRWGWVPGSARARPVYAPALVAFVGGANWRVSASIGSGGAVGWIPLAPGERYTPGYQASDNYLQRVNTGDRRGSSSNPRNSGDNGYRNRNAPGAVTAVSRDAFTGSRPVSRAALPVRPDEVPSARPTPVPYAGGQPVPPPRRPSQPDRGRGNSNQTQPPRPPGVTAAPQPPRQWRPRPRGGDQSAATPSPSRGDRQDSAPNRQFPRPSAPPAAQPTPVPPPVQTPPPVDQNGGRRNRPGNRDSAMIPPRGGRQDSTPNRQFPRPSAPPAAQPTPVPAPVQTPPPADQNGGRRNRPGNRDSAMTPPRSNRPDSVPNRQFPRPSGPPAAQPTPLPPPVQAPPSDQGGRRGRPGNRDSVTTPRPSGPPAQQPTPTPPPVAQPSTPNQPPPRARTPEVRPDVRQVQPDQATIQARRAQLATQHQQEATALEQRHQAERAAAKPADAAQIAQKQAQEKKALQQKQQHQRDDLEKQAHKPQPQ